MHDLAVRQDYLQAEHVVGRHTISEAVGAAGVLGDVAAERAGRLARRIGRVVEAAARNGLRQVEVDQPWLDRRPHVIGIHLQDAPHPGEKPSMIPWCAMAPPDRPCPRPARRWADRVVAPP